MPSLRRLSGQQVRKILEANGFTYVRQRGSHMVMQRRDLEGITVTVVVPKHAELKLGTLAGIASQCGLPRSVFEQDS